MRRLKKFLGAEAPRCQEDSERGAAAVVVAFSMVALLGFAALAVDVGAMYAEKTQLQTGADATALAIAGDCANGTICPVAMADPRNRLANANANDNSSGVFSVTQPTSSSVRVETNAQAAGSTDDSFGLFFAQVLGHETAVIHAAAEASWGPPSSGSTLPWTASECVFRRSLTETQLLELDTTGNFSGDPSSTHILLRYDERAPEVPGCGEDNGYMPGGFGWLEIESGCSADIDLDAEVYGQPGNHFPTAAECDAILADILDQPAFIPLYDSAVGNGNNTVYTLIGFAAFQVTGYRFGGSLEIDDNLAPDCSGNCRGLQGYFTRFVSIEEGIASTGGQPNFGGTVVSLSK